MQRVLVVGDPPSRRGIAAALRHGGFSPEIARSQRHAEMMLRRRQLAAVVVDLDEPEHIEAIQALRELTEQPIVVLSQHGDEWSRVRALDAGADDCLTKPYGIEEFLARLRASLRRFARAAEDAPITTDDFTINLSDRQFVREDGTEVSLSPTEWRILEVLLRRPGHLVGRSDLLRAVWGADAVNKNEYLRVYMAGVRRKVEPEPARPRYFITVPGLGLVFQPYPLAARGSA